MTWRGKVIALSDAPGRVKHLLLTLDVFANKAGWCNPGVELLAVAMDMTPRGVQKLRERAVCGYWLLYKPGRYKSHGGEYRLLPKDELGDIHWTAQRVNREAVKGWRIGPSKGEPRFHRTSHEVPKKDARESGALKDAASRVEEVTEMSEPTIACLVYHRHQTKHRLSGNGWGCPVCDDIRQRRGLARAIREAPTETDRRRFLATFNRVYGRVYGREAA